MSRENGTDRMRRLLAVERGALPPDGGPCFNRLIFATSPYLLQHAENPVDWYEWGAEAFRKAEAEDRPVFLSIGYATCHWCHVMAHESFEDPAVAEVLNRFFVAIKVDREERPDIDERYMTAAQMMTGSGGWPLTIIMTPDKRPFFAATYLPKEPRPGMPGLIELLERLASLWQTERERVEKSCASAMEALSHLALPSPGGLGEGEIFREAVSRIGEMYDPLWGGMGGAPKFPMPLYLAFLLRMGRRFEASSHLAMVERTLRMIRRGGVYDQLGFGVHRYAVDREWLVPHFEKMLYDQALLSIAYLEAFQATGDTLYLTVAREIFAYVAGEMTAPQGGFFSGEDADSEGEEGRYYLWTPAEVAETLGAAAPSFCRLFGVSPTGNFEGRSVLSLAVPEDLPGEGNVPVPEMPAEWRDLLLAVRTRRPRPFRDEKIVTAWNGMMVAALAKGYGVTGEAGYLEAARRGVECIGAQLRDPSGRLLRSRHRGEGGVPAFLEDYACYAWGLVELHQATLAPEFLAAAESVTGEMLRLFGGGGALFDTGSDAEQVLVRKKGGYDGVIPSGNSVAAMTLLRLGRITGDEGLLKAGEGVIRAFMGSVVRQPLAYLYLLCTLDFLQGKEVEVTIAGDRDDPAFPLLIRSAHRRFLPGLVLRHAPEAGPPVAHVCAGGACRPPVANGEELERLLAHLG